MKRIDTINVIPFIDIMLVLLAIVLTTATFIAEGRLDIRLPEADAKAEAAEGEPLEIAVDRSGAVFVDALPLSLPELGARLDGVPEATPIVLRVDGDARFAAFVAVVDLLEARAMERLTILTLNP
jgi:biopolymer transport protein ExbD